MHEFASFWSWWELPSLFLCGNDWKNAGFRMTGHQEGSIFHVSVLGWKDKCYSINIDASTCLAGTMVGEKFKF